MLKKMSSTQELEQLYQLSNYAFRGGNLASESHKKMTLAKFKHTDNYGVFTEGKLTNQVVSYPFSVNVYGVPMTMGGIGEVASYPEYRGQGGINQIFKGIFADYFENNTILSYLAPFSHVFYRKFGYATAMNQQIITLDQQKMMQVKPEKNGTIKRIEAAEFTDYLPLLKNLYQQSLGTENGTLIRKDWWWDYLLSKKTNNFVGIAYDEEARPRGYVFYEMNPSTGILTVNELAYLNHFGLNKLLTLISSHTSSYHTFQIKQSPNESWPTYLFPEPTQMKKEIVGDMMIRIVLLKEFIALYPFKKLATDINIVLNIEDASCPWNNGSWTLSIFEGKGTLTPLNTVENIQNEVRMDIQTLTQWFFNVTPVSNLIFHEVIHGPIEVIRHIDNLLPKESPQIYDYF